MVSNNQIVEMLQRLQYLYGVSSKVVYNVDSLKDGRNVIEYAQLDGWQGMRPVLSVYEYIRSNYKL